MEKAVIYYNSRTGITKKYAEEIGNYLSTRAVETHVSSIQLYQQETLYQAKFVLLGCWTSGLMVILQHPENIWVEFAQKLPSMPEAKLALFTTYKLLTGSMFKNMNKHLKNTFSEPTLELKSRNGMLSKSDKEALDKFIGYRSNP